MQSTSRSVCTFNKRVRVRREFIFPDISLHSAVWLFCCVVTFDFRPYLVAIKIVLKNITDANPRPIPVDQKELRITIIKSVIVEEEIQLPNGEVVSTISFEYRYSNLKCIVSPFNYTE